MKNQEILTDGSSRSRIIIAHSWHGFLKIKFYLVSAIWSRSIDPFDPANQLQSLSAWDRDNL